MRFSRLTLFGGPWLVPLCSKVWPAGVFFLLEFVFFPEKFLFSFSCGEVTLLVMLFDSKLTYCCRILEATEDLSLYYIFGVSWLRSASFDPFLGVPLSKVDFFDLVLLLSGFSSSSRIWLLYLVLFLVELQGILLENMFLWLFNWDCRCVLVFIMPGPDFGTLYTPILPIDFFLSVLGARFSSPHCRLDDWAMLCSFLEVPSSSGIYICNLLYWDLFWVPV